VRTRDWRLIKYFDGQIGFYHHTKGQHEWHNLANNPEHQSKLESLFALLPTSEVPTIEEHIAYWSLFGADKEHLEKTKNVQIHRQQQKKEKGKRKKEKGKIFK
jgi:hypothetical protein